MGDQRLMVLIHNRKDGRTGALLCLVHPLEMSVHRVPDDKSVVIREFPSYSQAIRWLQSVNAQEIR